MTITEILHSLLTLAGVLVVLGPVVVLVEIAHRRAEADGRSVRGFPPDPDDADARRVAAELRARAAETAPVPKLRGRRHAWVTPCR